MSNCCDNPTVRHGLEDVLFVSRGVSRRDVLKGLAGAAGAAAVAGLPACSSGDGDTIKLAFCSQLLCVTPYEASRAAGFFAKEGLDVQLIYTRGGSAAMQALNSGAVDYAATSFDAALSAFANGADIVRFATTGRLPLFALATSPQAANTIRDIEELKGKTIGVAELGNSDHALSLYLLKRAGVPADSVRFATLGPNLYHALRLGQVDAGMVQEPGLSLLKKRGAVEIANLMRIEDARRYLGGPYEFMGVAVRRAETEQRREQMRKLGRALAAGLQYMQQARIDDIMAALPNELIAGGDTAALSKLLADYRTSLYPTRVEIVRAACERVMRAHLVAGILKKPVNMDRLLDLSVIA